MIRFLRAFVVLRWRLLINGMRGGRRRDDWEGIARGLAVAVPVLLLLVFAAMAAGLCLMTFTAGLSLGSGSDTGPGLLVAWRLVLLVSFVLLLVIPALRGPVSGGTSTTRHLLLPVSRGTLHLINVSAAMADPWLSFLAPALLLALPAGLIAAGRPSASLTAAAAGVAMLAVLASFSALVSHLIQWLFRNRRRSELVTLALMLTLSLAAFMPTLIDGQRGRDRRREARRSPAETSRAVESLERRLPAWTMAIPSELYGRAVKLGAQGRPGPGLGFAGALALEALLFYWASSRAHGRVLASPEIGPARRRRGGLVVPSLRLPGLGPAAAAVAQAQARSALRTVRGKLALLLAGPIMLAFGAMSRVSSGEIAMGRFLTLNGYALLGAGILFGFLSLQPILLNQFATDRSGLTMQFLAPISDRDLVVGKAAAGALLFLLNLLICLAAALVISPVGPPALWLTTLAGGVAVYLSMAPVSAVLSALFPRAADLNQIGSAGNAHTAASLLATLAILLASGIPSLIGGLTHVLLGMPWLALALTLGWTAVTATIYLPLLEVAARTVRVRRENLALVALGK